MEPKRVNFRLDPSVGELYISVLEGGGAMGVTEIADAGDAPRDGVSGQN